MADACHLQFGKYTLFSCYGITANANMSPVAFAILFGNENGTAWKQFWEFCVDTHPTMNRAQVTIVTDQDKGQMPNECYCSPHELGRSLPLLMASTPEHHQEVRWWRR